LNNEKREEKIRSKKGESWEDGWNYRKSKENP